jgi:hypothetical protein
MIWLGLILLLQYFILNYVMSMFRSIRFLYAIIVMVMIYLQINLKLKLILFQHVRRRVMPCVDRNERNAWLSNSFPLSVWKLQMLVRN